MKDNILVRVVHKDKDGATIVSLDGRVREKIDWDTFKEYFVPTATKHLYEMKVTEEIDALSKEINERMEFITKHFAMLLIISNKQTPSLEESSYMGLVVREYGEKFKSHTGADFIKEFLYLKKSLTERFTG